MLIGEWYIDILAVYPNNDDLGIGRKLLVSKLSAPTGATKIALNCERQYEGLNYTKARIRLKVDAS